MDYNDLFERHEAEEARRLARYPKCSSCGEAITDDTYYFINDKIYCEDCLNDKFARSTYDYLEDF